MQTLYLKKHEDRRLRLGHLWVFSNEVDTARSPLKGFAPGEPVRIVDAGGGFVAVGYVNPASLISARILSRDPSEKPDRELLDKRLAQALALRQELYVHPFYRLVFGEGDLLPGLIVDRYGDILVVQLTTAGMERLKDSIVASLRDMLNPKAIILKNDSSARTLEGLDTSVTTAWGNAPAEAAVMEHGSMFTTPLLSGQKTGWFYDQRDNRAAFCAMAAGMARSDDPSANAPLRVLDVFCYTGSLGVMTAATVSAAEVLCVDSSAPALEYVTRNAQANGVADRLTTRQGDAFGVLRELRDAGQTFHMISLDPPAFIKRKKDMDEGAQAYFSINRLGLSLVRHGGFLQTCSCSQHLGRDDLRILLAKAAAKAGVTIQLLRSGGQAADHPVHPAMPETDYLKSLMVRVLRG